MAEVGATLGSPLFVGGRLAVPTLHMAAGSNRVGQALPLRPPCRHPPNHVSTLRGRCGGRPWVAPFRRGTACRPRVAHGRRIQQGRQALPLRPPCRCPPNHASTLRGRCGGSPWVAPLRRGTACRPRVAHGRRIQQGRASPTPTAALLTMLQRCTNNPLLCMI